MVNTVIFDLGNVILNFDHKLICERIAKYSKYSVGDIYHMGVSSRQFKLYDEGKIKSEELFQWILERFDIDISYDIFQSIWSEIFSLNDAMEVVLLELKKNGYNMILLSNTNELHFDYIRKNFKVIEIFDDHVLSYMLGYSKPHEEIFREALRRADSPGRDCVYIDDIEEFCEAARKLDINSITYRSTGQLVSELRKLGVTVD